MLQAASYDGGAVTIDPLNGLQGTVYPIGTRNTPSNNIKDAREVMRLHNLGALIVVGSLTLTGTDDVRDITILGQNPTDTFVHMEGTVLAEGVGLRNLFFSGVLSSKALLQDCILGNVEYSSGYVDKCVLTAATIKLYNDGVFLNCTSGTSFDGMPTIELYTDARLTVREHHGTLKITNSKDGNLSDLSVTGVVVLDATNIGGTITVNGNATIVDNTGEDCTVIDNTGQEVSIPPGENLDAKAVWEYPTRTLTDQQEVGLKPDERLMLESAAINSEALISVNKGGWKKLADGTVIFYYEDGSEFVRLKQFNSHGDQIHDGSWALLP
jgi:hypothetical protein